VHAVKLSVLSPSAIHEWKRSFLAKAGQDPISQRSAKVSVNSFLRGARSLFSPRIIRHLGLELPNPLPFAGVQYEPRASTKYRSAIDIRRLVEAARSELPNTDVEAFKVFLLAAFAGLRKREIDLVEWSAFGWDRGVISIVPTRHFTAKSEESYADVALDEELMELFRGYAARASSSFVIESPLEPRSGCLYDYYRCQGVFDRLIGWLRRHGVQTHKPLHMLRKEFGSMICASAGIHAASRALRHSAVAVTDQYYSDSRVRATVGLGHLLAPDKIVEFKQSEVA
jgi:integrase